MDKPKKTMFSKLATLGTLRWFILGFCMFCVLRDIKRNKCISLFCGPSDLCHVPESVLLEQSHC